ncbi:carboxypeptidase M32 [Micavibrio aeruginosavorus]|uniref:Metal-dependent carboxypeptidase n=1 Tax=Micavibrio aeruginosavorus EPB TaxID=349215 RepID=M4VDP5_9BACT|nr:carboxypeptidase M32 [Micavibrio aeruginosavorus]AGH97472.1 Thermostable carboxypeptidase 1 [Micavibrio aeruginosavorus EPB]
MTHDATHSAYEKLKDRFRTISNLGGAGSILYMDGMTVMKPGSDSDRSEQMMALASAGHMLLTDPVVRDWLDESESNATSLSPADQKNLYLMRRQWIAATALPESLVREIARLETEGNNMHTQYRASGNWAMMKPVYEQAFKTSREVGLILKDALGFNTAYEALLDKFSPGLKLSTVETEFAKLESALPPMIAEAMERQKTQKKMKPLGSIPVEYHHAMAQDLLRALGFDHDRGVFYTGDMHPLSGGTPDDSRLTTRYNPDHILDGLYTVMHETGHSLYEQGSPRAWRYQPVGHTMGMDVHESQSMILEYQACKIPEFIGYLSTLAHQHLPRKYRKGFTPDNLARHIFHVEPSFIRVAADELTYPGHIILRYNIERAMVEGAMTIDDLPGAWNDAMKKTFNLTPPDASKGHMQDVHWPSLSAGYFPAYTLGAMGAAQFFAAAVKSNPSLPAEIGAGQFQTLKTWLNTNVHGHGSLLSQDQLFTTATGEPLNAAYYLNHLSRRYLGRDWQP